MLRIQKHNYACLISNQLLYVAHNNCIYLFIYLLKYCFISYSQLNNITVCAQNSLKYVMENEPGQFTLWRVRQNSYQLSLSLASEHTQFKWNFSYLHHECYIFNSYGNFTFIYLNVLYYNVINNFSAITNKFHAWCAPDTCCANL